MEPMPSSLIQLANGLSRVIIPIIIAIGLISNSLNIIVLTRPTLFKHACSRYFLAHAGGNLFYLAIVLLYRLLADQYQIDPARNSMALCKIYVYISHMVIFLTPSFIVLASIDRWCASSTNSRLRSFSNIKTARWMILSTTILFVLFFINSAVLVDIRYTDPFGCSIRADTLYKQIYVYIQACLVSCLVPVLMVLFGMMTIYNIKKAQVTPANNSRERRTGRQLSYMLLLQVITHIILNVPSAVTYLMFVLPDDLKATPDFIFASLICVLPLHLSYTTAFFLYILAGQLYRKELVRLTNKILHRRHLTQVYPMSNTHTVQTTITK